MSGKFFSLLVIALVLIAGCMTPAPKETPVTTPATGSVEVSSAPPGAEVYLDNVYRGTTPVTIIGEPGPHTLELRLRDYQPWSKSIQIEGGAKGYVDTALVPVPVVTSPGNTAADKTLQRCRQPGRGPQRNRQRYHQQAPPLHRLPHPGRGRSSGALCLKRMHGQARVRAST